MVAITSFLTLWISFFLFYYLGGRDKKQQIYKRHRLLLVLAMVLTLSAILNYFMGWALEMQEFINASRTLQVRAEYLGTEQLLNDGFKKFYKFSLLSFMWAGYLYHYFPSNTKAIQKTLKIVAYLILSLFIPAISAEFSLDEIFTVDFMVTFTVVSFIVVTLLYFAKSHKKTDENII